jgi:hypothetical protein
MSVNKSNPLMPKTGSRAQRVLLELANYTQPVKEDVLMAAHGLGNMSPTFWRQGPYKSLVWSGLIERSDDGCWLTTPRGREVLAQGPIVPSKKAEPAPPPRGDVVQAAAPKPFTALKAVSWRTRIAREGAFDCRDIPSLHTGGSV